MSVTISAFNESQSFGMSNLGNTAGTSGIASGSQVQFLLAGGSNVSLSQSINGASGTITIDASWTTGAQSIGMRSEGNTSGTSGLATGYLLNYEFVGGNNITLSQSINGASGTLTISGPSGGGAGVSNLGNTAGTTGLLSNQLVFVGGSNITLSQSIDGSSGTITFDAPTQTSGAQSFGMSNLGNTDGTTGMASADLVQFVLNGGRNITLSQSLNVGSGGGTITIDGMIPGESINPVSSANASGSLTQFYAPGNHVHAGVGLAGVSSLGNTAGSTAVLPGRFLLVGGNHITLSMSTDASNGMTISIVGV